MTENLEPRDTNESIAEMPEGNFVPAWLAALVLVLLLAVMGVGGFVLRGIVSGDGTRVRTLEQAEVERWKKQADAHPNDVAVRLQLGYAYQKDKRYDRALEQYSFVLGSDPKNTGALYNRAVVYQQLGLTDKAEAAFWDVLEVQRDHALAAQALGEIYVKKGQYRSVLAAVRPVVKAHPEMANLQYLTGYAYERTNHPGWAAARYRLALEYAPDLVEAREGLRRLGYTE